MIPEEIERIALLGWHVFPGTRYTRAGMFKGAQEAATCDLDTLAGWHAEYPGCNWRVLFGPSRLWGLDLDTPSEWHVHDGIGAFKTMVDANGPVPPRPTLRSGGGGLAIFFKHTDQPLIGKSSHPAPGIDPRRGAQSQTVPPSIHHGSRQPYRWIVPPWETDPPAAPAWLLDALKPPPEPPVTAAPRLQTGEQKRNYAVAALHNATRRVAAAGNGTRNDTLNRECWAVCRFLSDGSLTESEVRECMLAAARACLLEVRQAIATINSALRARRVA